MTVIETLEEAIDSGFLLHGSFAQTDVLKPFKKGFSDKKWKMDRLLYATDLPAVALWFATLPESIRWSQGRRPPRQGSGYWGLRTTIRRHDSVYGMLSRAEIGARRPGYVYILPAKGFKRAEDDDAPSEFYSHDEVVPTKIIQVEPDDFPYPIVEINTDQEFRHFHKSLYVGFGTGAVREIVLPLCMGSKTKKLRCKIREMGVSEIKEFLKKNRGRKLNDIDYLNFAMVEFKFVDDVHGAKPDYTKKELPISLLLKEVYDDLIDAAYPLPGGECV